jgi:hypothetical protein
MSTSETLLSTAREFFNSYVYVPNIFNIEGPYIQESMLKNSIGSNRFVCYTAVGTFRLVSLQTEDEVPVSPFNKAPFRQFPFFSVTEMGNLFRKYQKNVHPGGDDQKG